MSPTCTQPVHPILSTTYPPGPAMDKKHGITHQIRHKLRGGAFADDRLWKRFSARRLELIDTLDLSSKKASEQEADIRRVSDSLRREFDYGPDFAADFDKLVRAAVQSVRRNRKRSSKTRPGDKRFKSSSPESFITEIARLRDVNDEIVDMSYPRSRQLEVVDHASATIESMLQPRLPPVKNLEISEKTDWEAGARSVQQVLINQIERSRSCAESVTKKSANLQRLGSSVVSACVAYVFEKSFESVNPSSIEYLRGKFENQQYLAGFFRQLDANAPKVSDEVAVTSLYTLLGGCVKDFGFTSVMMPLAKMFYFGVMKDYPFFAKVAKDFDYYEGRTPVEPKKEVKKEPVSAVVSRRGSQVGPLPGDHQLPHPPGSGVSSGVTTPSGMTTPSGSGFFNGPTASHSNHHPEPLPLLPSAMGPRPAPLSKPPLLPPLPPSLSSLAEASVRARPLVPGSGTASVTSTPHSSSPVLNPQRAHHKQVLLRFLDKVLEFSYPTRNSAPPRYYELVENARSAFNLASKTILGLRDLHTHQTIQTDGDLERIFTRQDAIELEVFTQGAKAIPIYELTSTVTSRGGTNSPRYLLPPIKPPIDSFQPLL
ncbi:hypothetical protein DICA3_F35146 [Diutina catenulata]